jgi:hypothetical protein
MKSYMPFHHVLLVGSTLILASCATQPVPEAYNPPGFFSGLWNGFTIFFALIGHLFDNSIRIYAFPNSGGWYDFGFFLGVSAFCGGAASASASDSSKSDSDSDDDSETDSNSESESED